MCRTCEYKVGLEPCGSRSEVLRLGVGVYNNKGPKHVREEA
jgi:hypothetical protein